MTLRVDQFFLPAAMVMAAASLVSSCALLPQAQDERAEESEPIERVPFRRMVQLDFGRNAVFAACIEPACPSVTRKTLANAQIATASGPVVLDPTAQKIATVHRAEMKAALEPADVDAVPPHKQPSPLVLYFPLGGAVLTPSDQAALDEIIPYASKAERIVIAGRTDNIGSDTANQAVALARANTVRDYRWARRTNWRIGITNPPLCVVDQPTAVVDLHVDKALVV